MPETATTLPLPPGLRRPLAAQTAWWGRDPIGLYDHCAERFGEVFTVKVGYRGDVVCVWTPEAMKELFLAEPTLVHAGDAYEILAPVAGERSILLLDEDEHLRMRRLLLPPLHGDALSVWSSAIAEITEKEVASWPWDQPFGIRHSMETITMEVIMQIVFGIRDGERGDELRRLLPCVFEIGPLLGLAFLFPALRQDLGRWSAWGRFLRRREEIDRLLFAEIASRREEIASRGDDPKPVRQDVLTLLLEARDDSGKGMSDLELRDTLVSILLAGHETTATALAWTFERLVRHPRQLAMLESEIATDDTEYLDAVIKEALRVRPVVAQVGRVVTEPTEIGGWTIPQDQMVMGLISRLHRSPDVFPDPLSFRPERFLDGGGADSYTWGPFGGGVRRCIGAGLALLEMRIVIATVLRSARLSASRPADEGVKVRGITLTPAKDGRVVKTA